MMPIRLLTAAAFVVVAGAVGLIARAASGATVAGA
jgi:hypothetical protein